MGPEPEPKRAAATLDEATTVFVRRAKGGDLGAVAWIVERFSPMLHAAADYRLGTALRRFFEPQDVVQEVWLIALPRLPDLGATAERRTPVLVRFLTTTLFNVVMGLARKYAAGAPRGADMGEAAAEAVPDELTGAVTAAMRRESGDLLGAAMAGLPETERALVVLRGIESRPYRDIAAVLGDAPAILAVRYARALKKLRGRLPDSALDAFATD